MKYRTRIYYSESQKALMWDRWQKGDTLHQIAKLFDRHHASIRGILAETGGIRPAPRRRPKLALTLAEREEISRAVVAGHSLRSIAASLGRAPSTISRELNRNGGEERYRASQADQAAWDRARRPKTCKLAQNRTLARIVAGKLQLEWSPEQIAGWLKRTYPDDDNGPGVTRDHLPQPLYSGPWGPEERVVAALEAHTRECAVRAITRRRRTTTAGLLTRYRSASDRPRLRTGPCRVIGKATCCSAARIARSRRSWNVKHAT